MLITKDPADVDFARAWAVDNSYMCQGLSDPNDFGSGWGYSALDELQPGVPSALALGATMSAALAKGKQLQKKIGGLLRHLKQPHCLQSTADTQKAQITQLN
jgi:hypothetical protein